MAERVDKRDQALVHRRRRKAILDPLRSVRRLDEALRRIDEYALPLEEARAQAAYGRHTGVNKILIINRELTPGRITVVLVDEVLGF